MKQYQPAQMDIVLIGNEDVLTVSTLLAGGEYVEGSDKVPWDAPVFE